MNRRQIVSHWIKSTVQMLVLVVVAAAFTTGADRVLASDGRDANGWVSGPSLAVPVSYPAVTSTEDGRVWVFGGFDPDSNALKTVRVLSPQTGRWTNMPPLPTARGSAVAVVVHDSIYVIGGTPTDVGQFNTVEVFNLAS